MSHKPRTHVMKKRISEVTSKPDLQR